LEKTPQEYIARLVEIFAEVHRVLRNDGTLWLNIGDSYVANATGGLSSKESKMTGGRANQQEASRRPDKKSQGLKPKDLMMIPARVAIALQEAGWYLRADIIWHKPNCMPESVTDRPTKSHEYVFLLAKNERYFYDADAIAEKSIDPESHKGGNVRNDDMAFQSDAKQFAVRSGLAKIQAGKTYPTKNARSVWTISTQSFPGAHFACMPPDLARRCVLAGCPIDGVVLDPFAGAGTTGIAAIGYGRKFLGIELNPEYIEIMRKRLASSISQELLCFDEETTNAKT